MFDAGLGDLSRESLGDLGRFANAPSLRDQARDIGARREKATFLEWLDV